MTSNELLELIDIYTKEISKYSIYLFKYGDTEDYPCLCLNLSSQYVFTALERLLARRHQLMLQHDSLMQEEADSLL